MGSIDSSFSNALFYDFPANTLRYVRFLPSLQTVFLLGKLVISFAVAAAG